MSEVCEMSGNDVHTILMNEVPINSYSIKLLEITVNLLHLVFNVKLNLNLKILVNSSRNTD